MPAPALRFEAPTFEPLFVESLTSYVTLKCREYRVRREDVIDVVQEALTTTFASVRMYRPEKGDFDTWARGVARNVIRRHLRRAKRHSARFAEYHPDVDDYATQAPSPERCAQRQQARISIAHALGKLTAQQTSVVVSFDIDDMSHIEIANDLHITQDASQMCHKRAHIRLAGCLDRELLSVMPPFLTSCNDSVSFNAKDSRWPELSHYIGQVTAAIMAVFFAFLQLLPQMMHEPTTSDALVLTVRKNASMCRLDEPVVLRDAPSGKPEPASLHSVRDISTPAKRVDKPRSFPQYVPRLSYKHEPSFTDYRPNE